MASVEWTESTVIDETTVELLYPSDDYKTDTCWEPRPRITYETDRIEIDLRFARVNEMCTLEGRNGPVPVTITLEEPIAKRSIVPG